MWKEVDFGLFAFQPQLWYLTTRFTLILSTLHNYPCFDQVNTWFPLPSSLSAIEVGQIVWGDVYWLCQSRDNYAKLGREVGCGWTVKVSASTQLSRDLLSGITPNEYEIYSNILFLVWKMCCSLWSIRRFFWHLRMCWCGEKKN